MPGRLVQRADEVATAFHEHPELRDVGKTAAALQTRLDMLSAGTRALGPGVESRTILTKCGIGTDLSTVAVALMADGLSEIRKAFDQDPMSITRPHGGRKYAFWEQLATAPANIRTELEKSWEDYLESLIPTTDQSLLQVLSQIPALAQRVANVTSALLAFQKSRGRLPADASEVDSARDAAQEFQRAWSQLVGEGIPDEVVSFLQRVSSGGAFLTDVTAKVKSWLATNDLEGQLRITLQPSTRR